MNAPDGVQYRIKFRQQGSGALTPKEPFMAICSADSSWVPPTISSPLRYLAGEVPRSYPAQSNELSFHRNYNIELLEDPNPASGRYEGLRPFRVRPAPRAEPLAL